MDGEQVLSEKTYPCVFDEEIMCPVRKTFKLSPESLVEFCKCCKLDQKNLVNMLNQMAPLLIEKFAERQKTESLQDVIRNFQEMTKMLGLKPQESPEPENDMMSWAILPHIEGYKRHLLINKLVGYENKVTGKFYFQNGRKLTEISLEKWLLLPNNVNDIVLDDSTDFKLKLQPI